MSSPRHGVLGSGGGSSGWDGAKKHPSLYHWQCWVIIVIRYVSARNLSSFFLGLGCFVQVVLQVKDEDNKKKRGGEPRQECRTKALVNLWTHTNKKKTKKGITPSLYTLIQNSGTIMGSRRTNSIDQVSHLQSAYTLFNCGRRCSKYQNEYLGSVIIKTIVHLKHVPITLN